MKKLTHLMLALAAGVIAFPVLANERVIMSADAIAAHNAVPAAALVARVRAPAPNAVGPKVVGTSVYPGTPGANAFRAYPPSCAADPLPDNWQNSTPTYSKPVVLYATNPDRSQYYFETVTVTVWRIACSSSGAATTYNPNGLYNAMTLVRFDRAAQYDHDADIFPTMPQMLVSQNGAAVAAIRMAVEPNTVISDTVYDTPMVDSTTFVLENLPYTGSGYFKFSDAFSLVINPNIGQGVTPISVPDYAPTQATYPDAFALLPLDGYAAAQWVGGPRSEGLLVQITEQPQTNGSTVRQLVFDLLTKDTNGDPLWLVGNAAFAEGAQSLIVNTNYLGNQLTQSPWGTAKFELVDCNHLDVTFSPNSQLPSPIASFSGLSSYDRLFSANGMLCE
jgi:hypothetical protein